eukprot:gene37623-49264_t
MGHFVYMINLTVSHSSYVNHARSLREIFPGIPVDYNRDVRIAFGDYLTEYPGGELVSNNMETRSYDLIALGHTGSLSGSIHTPSLNTGGIGQRESFRIRPTTPLAIQLMNRKAILEGNTSGQLNLIFEHGANVLEDDEIVVIPPDDIPNVVPTVHSSTSDQHIPLAEGIVPVSIPLVELAGDSPIRVPISPHLDYRGVGTPSKYRQDYVFDHGDHLVDITSELSPQKAQMFEESDMEPMTTDGLHQEVIMNDLSSSNNIIDEFNALHDDPIAIVEETHVPIHQPSPAKRHNYDLRPRKPKRIFNVSVRKALKLYEDKALVEITRELKQMLDKKVWSPLNPQDLSKSQLKSVIRSSFFLKEKFLSSGEFDKPKGRLVAGGNMQDHELYGGEDLSSLTVSTSTVFIIAALAAKKRRKVITLGIGILTTLDCTLHDLPTDDGSLLVRLDKALYGCIEAAKLWYRHLRSTLESHGFV